jgi:hypothetical protein
VWLELSPIVDDDDPNGWCDDLDEVEIRTATGIVKKLALTQSFSSLPLNDDERALLVALRDATVPPTGVTEKIS